MISCLTNYITMTDVGTTDPASGRYLNELPGVDTTQLDAIKREEVYDLETAWDDIERRAIRRFESKLNVWGAKYFRNYSNMENTVTGQYSNNTAVPAGTNLLGWKFGDFLSAHKNITLVIQWAKLYSDSAVTGASIYVYNSSNGDLIDTITADLVTGINTIYFNKE